MAGLAVDSGLLYLAHAKLRAALDAGALAGALQLPFDPDLSKGVASKAAKDMVAKNSAEASVAKVYPGSEARSVCLDGSITTQLTLMPVLGIDSGVVTGKACAGFNNLEIVFVIDNTGSMNGTPIQKVKQAAVEMANLIIPDGMAPSTKVGLVPFRGKVRIGSGVDGLAAGCRNADGTLNTVHYRYDSNTRKYVTTSNDDTCLKAMPQTLPLSTTKTSIVNAINSMTATSDYASGTIISEGIKWGRNVLTPESPFTQGGDAKKFRKVLILLTDGDTEDGECGGQFAQTASPNAYWNNSYHGMGDHDCDCRTGGCLDQAMLKEADLAKQAGVEIFAIRYGESDANDVQLMKTVASSKVGTDDHYFDAPTPDEFDEIFKQIGKQLGWRLLN